jgi:hypothetical protein
MLIDWFDEHFVPVNVHNIIIIIVFIIFSTNLKLRDCWIRRGRRIGVNFIPFVHAVLNRQRR